MMNSNFDVYPPDTSTMVGKVRALIADTKQLDYDQNDEPRYMLTDAELEVFIEGAGEKLYASAASALLAIAVNEALINKVIKTEDLSTDGAKLATELRLNARDLFNRQKEIDATEIAQAGESFMLIPNRYPYINPDW